MLDKHNHELKVYDTNFKPNKLIKNGNQTIAIAYVFTESKIALLHPKGSNQKMIEHFFSSMQDALNWLSGNLDIKRVEQPQDLFESL